MPRLLRSRHFKLTEVFHSGVIAGLEPLGYFMMGYLECLRAGASHFYGVEVSVIPTSGNRNLARNVAAGGVSTSNHAWKVNADGSLGKVAVDTVVKGISLEQWFDYVKTHVAGEVYINHDTQCVHIAPCGPIKAPFRKRGNKYLPD